MIDNFEAQLNEIAQHVYNCQAQIGNAHRETLRIVDESLEKRIEPKL